MITPARAFFRGMGSNFITPDVIEYGHFNSWAAYELSTGAKILNSTPFGVTVVFERPDGKKIRAYTPVSRCCFVWEDANSYINSLRFMLGNDLKGRMGAREMMVLERLARVEMDDSGFLVFISEAEPDGHRDTFLVTTNGTIN